ncbi:putative transporter MCH2 [Cyphellophora attinorum]|uniref:Putative transporter MCH2 n=1 Tax=Cyphellophora attinorum TaxID=1664694 RepID=A0A0N1H4J5_9EURO|nr:putative transporter MCH2 [Phialophora attinorum]KPI40213.1 putative transporter MCH2 [Phialophora attinorum]
MSSTVTLTRSSIELQARNDHEATSNEPGWQASTQPTDPDNVFEASRIADAAVPDGGYGWVIVTASSVVCFWFVGTTYSWGVIQTALFNQKVASASTLAFVGSLAIACNAAFAIPNGRLTRAIGGLFVCAGLMMGYGVSCCYMVVSVLTAQYFSRRRGLANGLVFAGGGVGGAIISLSMSAIIQRLGIGWTFRLIGLLMLITGLPVAWLLKERAPIRTADFIDFSLFKDFKFLMVFFIGAVATFPLCVPPFFLPLYAQSLGYSPYTGAAMVAGFNGASAIGRIVTGFTSDKVGALNSLFGTLLLSALSMLCIWPVSSSLGPLIVFVVLNGMGNGGFFSLWLGIPQSPNSHIPPKFWFRLTNTGGEQVMPTVAAKLFGSVRVSVAMGTIVSSWTGGYLMGAPIAGYILDAYGGAKSAGFKAYRPAIFYAGSLAMASALLTLFLRLKMSKNPLKAL